MREETLLAIQKLDKKEIDYDIKNNGIQLIVTDFQGDKIDFYPTTGKFQPRGGLASNGLNNLIRYIEKKGK